ncbi:MAG: hypothetical protein PUD23_10495 [Prevotella sp.]|nr:hypothetical protein [Prevotella sp.]
MVVRLRHLSYGNELLLDNRHSLPRSKHVRIASSCSQMTEAALRTFVAAPCQCTRLTFGLAISHTLHSPTRKMSWRSTT